MAIRPATLTAIALLLLGLPAGPRERTVHNPRPPATEQAAPGE